MKSERLGNFASNNDGKRSERLGNFARNNDGKKKGVGVKRKNVVRKN